MIIEGLLFSPQDADLLSLNWHLDKGYARRSLNYNDAGKRPTISAHQVVARRAFGSAMDKTEPKLEVDHINFNTLDNRRENLRMVTHKQNLQHRNGAFRGTSWYKECNKWRATVKTGDTTYYLGAFQDRGEAAAVAKKKRLELGFPS